LRRTRRRRRRRKKKKRRRRDGKRNKNHASLEEPRPGGERAIREKLRNAFQNRACWVFKRTVLVIKV
jgi:hypothetical protein